MAFLLEVCPWPIPVSQIQELPLFPLNTVLFPGMTLPLHIFEPRYKVMIKECIDQSRPFGVVLLRSGSEIGLNRDIFHVGTTAFITHIEHLDEGQMSINALGCNRFRVKNLDDRKPYLSGTVEDFPLENAEHPNIPRTARLVGLMLRSYLNIFATLGNVELKVDTLPTDPAALAFLTAIVIRTPIKDKQRLLDIPDLLKLLQMESQMLSREAQILKMMIEDGPRWRDDPMPFTHN